MKTAKILNISIILFVISMVLATWVRSNEETPFVAVLVIICFALNVAGVFVGLFEERKSKKKFLYGVIGNSFFVALYMTFFLYVLVTMSSR